MKNIMNSTAKTHTSSMNKTTNDEISEMQKQNNNKNDQFPNA